MQGFKPFTRVILFPWHIIVAYYIRLHMNKYLFLLLIGSNIYPMSYKSEMTLKLQGCVNRMGMWPNRAAYKLCPGYVDTIKKLVESGAEPNMRIRDSHHTILTWFVESGSLEDITCLLSHGANPNMFVPVQETPLVIAARKGDPNIVQALLDYKADPLIKDGIGMLPLEMAKESGNKQIVTLLERHIQSKKVNIKGP